MPRFAVIIPARNAAATLPAALASLRAQVARDWEAVVVDDGSTDATRAIAEAAAAADPRIRAVDGPRRGPSAARNAGVAATWAPVLAFLDADDLWAPGKLDLSGRAIAAGADAVFGRVSFFSEAPEAPEALSARICGPVGIERVLGENPTCTMSNVAVTRAAFERSGGFDETMRHGEDLEWLIRLVGGGARLAGLPETLVHYRRSEGGLSSDLPAMRAGHARAMQTARAMGIEAGDAPEAVHLRYLARRALRLGGDPRAARDLALSGLRLSPRAFLSPLRRGLPTLAAAIAAPILR